MSFDKLRTNGIIKPLLFKGGVGVVSPVEELPPISRQFVRFFAEEANPMTDRDISVRGEPVEPRL